VSTSASTARIAARLRAFPANVPRPAYVHDVRSLALATLTRRAKSSLNPKAPQATPPPSDLPMVSASGARPSDELPRRSGRERVGLVKDQQGARRVTERAHSLEETGFGQDNADVGEGWLAQHRGDVAVGQFAGQP